MCSPAGFVRDVLEDVKLDRLLRIFP